MSLLSSLKSTANPLSDLGPDIFFILDLKGTICELHTNWERLLGWSCEESLQRAFLDFCHHEDQASLASILPLFAHSLNQVRIELRLLSSSGDYRPMVCILSFDLARHQLTGTARDQQRFAQRSSEYPSDDRAAAMRLLSSSPQAEVLSLKEREFRNLAEIAPDIITRFDRQLRHVYVNPAVELVTGRPRSQFIGRTNEDLGMPADLCQVWRDSLHRVFQSGQPEEIEFAFPSPHGQRYFHLRAVPEYNSRGDIEFVVTIARDITERKVDQIKMMQASKMSSLGEMAGGIAHEVNNPLTIIIGKARQIKTLARKQMLSEASLIAELEKIEATAQRIARIVRGLNTFCRNAEADPMEEAQLSSMVLETLELCQERFRKAEIDIQLDLDPDLRLRCRPTEISQILLNLLNNAFDAIVDLDVRWVRITSRKMGRDRLELSIIDSGLGIPEPVAKKLMQPFFTTKEVGKGTGLGLSLVKGLVAAHHGQIYYDRSSAHTRFVVDLPRLAIGPS